MKKNSKISKTASQESNSDSWLKEFEESLIKTAVYSREDDYNLFNRINSIMNGKPKYQSVQSAVEDMKMRSGLTKYLENIKISEEKESTKKIAQNNSLPKVVQMNPEIGTTIQNIVESSHGTSPVFSILERVKSIYKNDGLISDPKYWENDDIPRYISRLNLIEKSKGYSPTINSNLGKVDYQSEDDPSNSDAFIGLMPAKND